MTRATRPSRAARRPDVGEGFASTDPALPVATARAAALRSQLRAENGQCFNNALAATIELGEGAVYVEGYALNGLGLPIPLEHGWVEYDGVTIDPTPAWWMQEKANAYFPARRIPYGRLFEVVKAACYLLPTYPLNSLVAPEMRAAYIAATRHTMGSGAEAWLRMHPWYEPHEPQEQQAAG